MMGPRIGRNIGHQLELVALRQRNIPGHRLLEPMIPNRRLAGMPGEENLDCDVIALRQTPVERHVVLDRMRDDDREPDFCLHHSLLHVRGSDERRDCFGDAAAVILPGKPLGLRPDGKAHRDQLPTVSVEPS